MSALAGAGASGDGMLPGTGTPPSSAPDAPAKVPRKRKPGTVEQELAVISAELKRFDVSLGHLAAEVSHTRAQVDRLSLMLHSLEGVVILSAETGASVPPGVFQSSPVGGAGPGETSGTNVKDAGPGNARPTATEERR